LKKKTIMYSKSVIVFAFLLSTSVFALPLNIGGGSSDGASSNGDSGPLSGLLNGKLLVVLKVLPLNAGINGVVGDLITLVRVLLEKVIQILQRLLPSLSTEQLDELTALLKNENMTKSEILQTIDGWIAGQPIELQKLYKSIVEDVEGKVDATFDTLKNIAYDISPEVGELVEKLGNIVQDELLTLLQEDEAIGNLLSNLLKNVDKLLKQLLKDLDRLLTDLLSTLNLDDLLNLDGLLQLDGLLKDGLLGSLLGENGVVNRLLDGLLGGILGDDGLLGGGLLGDKKGKGLLGLGVLGLLKK